MEAAGAIDPGESTQVVDPAEVVASVVCPRDDEDRTTGDATKQQPIPEETSEQKRPTTHLYPRTKAGFLHIYGWMGVPMIVIFLMSAAWTIMLAVIQQIPTHVANYLMDTGKLDFGEFWLLPKPGSELSIPATLLLVLFGVGYLGLAVLMVFPDKLLASRWNRSPVSPALKPAGKLEATLQARPDTATEAKIQPIEKRADNALSDLHENQKIPTTKIPVMMTWERLRYEMTSPDGLVHQYYNPILDLPKLIFQTTTLLTYLHNGFPLAVVFIYSCALFVNWLISSYRYKRERPDPHYVTARIFYCFDLFFAVFAPLEVLCYAYYTFEFPRDEFATRTETMSPGTFDRTARLFADPTQISMFRIAFHYLQFTAVGGLLIKSALNVLSLFKWWRTIIHLVEHARAKPHARASQHMGSLERALLVKTRRRKYLQNLVVAGLFLCAGTATFIHSIVAVVSTRSVCRAHTQCKVLSYQWNVGAQQCSCIVFVDRETVVKTMAEWESPIDTSANLAALAATGNLRIIQIINRQVETLPVELRACHHLEQLILIYTKTVTIPDWAKEFKHLEYLHVEGDQTAKQLTYMPRDMFADMPHLLFLHLGCLMKLPYIPDLNNLHHLQYLVLALLHSATVIPSLDGLHSLQKLNIIDAIQVYELPSVKELVHLKTFSLTSRNPVCCNGFITGTCDLSDFSCLDRTASGEPLVQCSTKQISAEDFKVLNTTEGLVCETGLTFDIKDLAPTFTTTDEACGGVTYKQCTLGGVAGMCYPGRFQPVSCQLASTFQDMRRLQIERGVGQPCDPAVEAWLGCEA